ncbi:MAG TPA: RraA family protein [Burkholderiales bacterium]
MSVTAEVLKTLASLPVATVYEAAGKLGDVSPALKPMVEGVRLAGPAFTLKTMPGDNKAVFHAIDQAPKGSVLVIDGGGTDRVTIWGGTSTVAAQAKGLAGVVTNAAVRDLDEIRQARFPVYAPGSAVRGTAKSHPGWMNVPLAIGDAIVRPGDIVLGDADGLLIVPAEQAAEICARAVEKRKQEESREARLRAGESIKSVLGL